MGPNKNRKGIPLVSVLLVVFVGHAVVNSDNAQFYGGSMSFDVEKSGAEYKAHIKILTAWKIGYGPCGTSCTFDRIGQSTNQSRSMALNTHGKYYLGMWVAEREELHTSKHTYTDMTDEVTDHTTEIVQFVNVKQDWEQEQAEITVSFQPNTNYVDVKFNGSFWVGSTGVGMAVTPSPASVINVYQPAWFMQCKITIAVRSDTNRSNCSPVLQMKPYYRLALGQKREMKVSYVDEDDDIVKCSIATIGTSNGIKAPTGISVNEKDCVIIFEISNNTYGLHDTGIVLIDVMDFNVKDMILGDGPDADKYPGSKTSSRSLSTVALQFYFEVVDELNPPEFINPTPPNGQMFEIFVGAKFRVLVVARPTASNDSVLIDIIFFTQNLRFKFETSNITNRPDIDPRARSVTVTWLPTHNEIGKHLLCPNVLDNTGESNFEQYCFPVTVRDMPTRNVTALPGMPYFLQFPGNTDIICQVSSVCSFPIYAKTQDPGGITDISIVRPEIFNLKIVGQLKPVPTIDPDAKMIEVSFQDSRHGTKQFCVKASDQKTSTEQCTFITIKPVDPCMSAPCRNGECLSKEDGTYQCICQFGFQGELCDIPPDYCKNYDCKNGGSCIGYTGGGAYCDCPPGVTGMNCENLLSACNSNICPGQGMCVDNPGQNPNFICLPLALINCTMFPNNTNCSGCTNGPNFCNAGKCLKTANGDTCICPEGYTGRNCETAIDTTRPSGLNGKFVAPTLAPGSVITCDPMSGGLDAALSCEFIVFVYWNKTGEKPLVERTLLPDDFIIDRASEIGLSRLRLSLIDGFTNTLQGTVTLYSKQPKTFKPGMHSLCFVVKQGTIETDQRCFIVNINAQPILIHRSGDGIIFESPTLPEHTELVCIKNTACHIHIYTSHSGNGMPECSAPVYPLDAPCTVIGPNVTTFSHWSKACHSDIVYNTGSLAIGSKEEMCIMASGNGERRCFIIHVVASIQDPCSPNPCKNGGFCTAQLDGTHSCICDKDFYGDNCQIGSCSQDEAQRQDCQNGGHCHTDGTKTSCYCRLGTEGRNCNYKTSESITNPGQEGAKFAGSSLPVTIKCHIDEPCDIPSVLTGDPHKKPSVTLGFVDSGIEMQATKVNKDNNNGSIYHSVTTIVPKTPGYHKKVCVQSLTAANETSDEVCYFIDVTSDPSKAFSDKKPQFISPTLSDGSSIQCSVGKPCHITLWVKNHHFDGSCPEIVSDIKVHDGVYVFYSEAVPSPCSRDVSISTNIERTFQNCFTVSAKQEATMSDFGGDGEIRCYNVKITNDTSDGHGPCSSTKIKCLNGGFCNGKESTAICQCPSGYSGDTCGVAEGNTLTEPVSNMTKPIFGDLVIPKKVVCVLHEECSVPFTVTSSSQLTLLKPGRIDPGLTTKPPTMTQYPNHPTGTVLTSFNVVGTAPGVHTACVQTGTAVGSTNDEVCFEVEIKTPESNKHTIKTNQPYFKAPTITHDSETQCVPGKSCHILLFMSGGGYPDCPSIKQTEGPTDDLHLFISGNCSADVVLTPPSGATGKPKFCFNTFFPNVPGEIRCFYVKYEVYKDSSPTCKGHNCLDSSVCDVVDGQPKCICALLQAGSQCEKNGCTISTVLTTQPGITDYPLPKLIKCEVGRTCEVQILVTDTQNKPSVTSKIDGIPAATQPNVTQESKYPNGKYKVTIPVTASTPGLREVCVNVSQSAGQHCFKVEAYNPTASAPTNAGGQFVNPSLPPNSTVICTPGSTCHLVVYQRPQNNLCEPVIGEAIPGGAHIITSSAPNGNGLCETDVIYQPKAGTTSQKICVTSQHGSSGTIGESRCYSVDPSLQDPCHNLNCNSGECTVSDGTARCRCPIGTTGLLCNEDTKNFVTGNSSTKPAFVDTVKPKKIICYQGSGCGILIAVSNNGSQSPSLQVGNPQITTITTKPIPGTNISQAVVPTQTSGSMCVNVAVTSGDKVCYEVEIKQEQAPTQTGSSFTNNTMGPHSTVSCEAGVSCHMVIETTPESGGKCPKIQNSDPVNQNDKIADVYAFTPKQESSSSPCKTDVVITPSKSEIGNKQVCIKIDKSPSALVDQRCYNVDVTKGDACKHIQCLNGGLCDEVDKQEGAAVCICPTGFSGNRCQNVHESQLTPFKEQELTTEEKKGGTPKFTGTSLPETITCHLGKPCHLPLKVTDNTGKTPSIGFGHVDPGIVTLPPQVTPEGHSVFSTDVVVTPTKLGKRKICVQTKNTDNINMDEVCYNIDTTATDTAKPGLPKFTEPTVSENSVVICPSGETCHIPLTYEKGSGNCEPVNEITQTPGVHVFTTPPSGQTCKVDVGFTPKPDQQGTSQMCFKPGSQGEQRCITVKVEDTSSSAATSCQSHHCHRNGFCSVPSGSQAVCTCPLGTAGTNCKNDSFQSVVTGSTDPGTKFVGTVLPREVKCYTGQPCLIPFTVNGNSQQMFIGDKDPGLNPVIEPGQKINSTNIVQYSLKVTPTSSSKKSVCVNPGSSSDSKEQICFTIDVVDPPTGQVNPPIYTGITLGPDSTVDCQTETLCHIQVQTSKKGNGKCPSLLQNTEDTSISDIHIFPTDSSSCITDVAFKPMVTETGQKQICIQTDAQYAEDTKRCFQVVVSHDKDPCIPIYCQNNGECEVTTTTNGNTGQCICPAGFTGDKCQTPNSEQVTPVELSNITSPEKPHFTATAVPKVINCVQDEPCHVPLTVTEPSGHTPSVKYGEVDPGLNTKKPVLTRINGTKDFTTDVVVTPQRPGSKKLCVQTQTSLGMNVDEICYEIHTSGPNSSLATKPTPTGSPIFTAPTVTDSSTLICETGKVCHIPLTYQGLRGKCEEIIEAVNHQDGVHIFKPPVQPTAVEKTCTTDVAYKPPTAGTKELCFKPGPYGEERCLHIETKDTSLLNTSCQMFHCQNGGDCVAGVCVCTVGTAGLDCSQKTSISITEKGGRGKIVFTDTVLPQEVVCYKGENCTVPFVVTRPGASHQNFIPNVYLQQTYTDLNPVLTSPTHIGNNTDSFRTELTLTPTVSGDSEFCMFLANSVSKTDQHCMKIAVKVRPTAYPVIAPKFTAKTLYSDTLIACKVNAFCHLPMETELKPDKQCPTLSKDDSTTTTADIHPMETKTDGITCTTDVVIHPTKSETGLKHVCIQFNVSPSEGPRCYRLNVTAANPCVSLLCQNQGECKVTNNTGQCICRAVFTGDKSTTTPLLPLGCIDYEDDSFSCTTWNDTVGICKASTKPVRTIALQRCPRFCNICKSENVQPTPTVQGCQDMPGVDCHTLIITNICSCNRAFGSKYCSNYCNLCTNLQLLTPGPDFLNGK